MISMQYSLILSSILFSLGLFTVILRYNLLFILIGLEIMINASALVAIVAGAYWQQTHGQILFIVLISIAAVEASIGLSLLLKLYYRKQTLNINFINEMKE